MLKTLTRWCLDQHLTSTQLQKLPVMEPFFYQNVRFLFGKPTNFEAGAGRRSRRSSNPGVTDLTGSELPQMMLQGSVETAAAAATDTI